MGRKKKESKVGAEIVAEPLPLLPPAKASKGKRVKIVEEIERVPDVQPKLNKKSQKKSQPPPPPVAQTKKGGIKRKVKKKAEDPDRLTLTRELQSVKKDLDAARRANVKPEKEQEIAVELPPAITT